MPCYDPDNYALMGQREHNQQMDIVARKVDDLTRLLCDCCKMLESIQVPFPNEEVAQWWEMHQKSKGHTK